MNTVEFSSGFNFFSAILKTRSQVQRLMIVPSRSLFFFGVLIPTALWDLSKKGNPAMITLRKINPGGNRERFRLLLIIAVFPLLGLSGCEILGDIFQAGVWVGVILVVGVIALIAWLVSRAKG